MTKKEIINEIKKIQITILNIDYYYGLFTEEKLLIIPELLKDAHSELDELKEKLQTDSQNYLFCHGGEVVRTLPFFNFKIYSI